MDCILHTLANNNECPICREHITINEMAIIKETIPDYSSEIIDYFQTMDKYTIILSDMPGMKNTIYNLYIENTPKFFNLKDKRIMEKIKKISKINNIFIITSNDISYHKYLKNFIGYFNSFNIRPIITQINIPIL